MGCTKQQWDHKDDFFVKLLLIYDEWEIPITFFFLILISFHSSGQILWSFTFLEFPLLLYEIFESMGLNTDIPEDETIELKDYFFFLQGNYYSNVNINNPTEIDVFDSRWFFEIFFDNIHNFFYFIIQDINNFFLVLNTINLIELNYSFLKFFQFFINNYGSSYSQIFFGYFYYFFSFFPGFFNSYASFYFFFIFSSFFFDMSCILKLFLFFTECWLNFFFLNFFLFLYDIIHF
jgi:hypothetical protein